MIVLEWVSEGMCTNDMGHARRPTKTADCLKGTAEEFSLGQGHPQDPTVWLLLYDPRPLHWGYIGVYIWGYVGLMENKMKTSIWGSGFTGTH